MNEKNNVRDAADAVKGVVEAIPIYQDALQPAAKELGTGLQTVAKTIHIALAPVSALVWGYDKIKDFVSTRVAEKLRDVPPENIITPKPNVAGPILESLRYTGHEETLREMYANLLAASMDKRTATHAHPAFAEMIRQLVPDEGKLLSIMARPRALPLLDVRWKYKSETPEQRGGMDVATNFSLLGWEANCEFPDEAPKYIDNLCRLGLAEVPTFLEYTAPNIYEPLEQHPIVVSMKRAIEARPEHVASSKRKGLRVTELGKQFCHICVIPHEEKAGTKM